MRVYKINFAEADRSGLLIKTREEGRRILKTERIYREVIMNTAQNV